MFYDVRISEANNKLAFKWDPISDIIQIRIKGETYALDWGEARNDILRQSLTFDAERDTIDENLFLLDP